MSQEQEKKVIEINWYKLGGVIAGIIVGGIATLIIKAMIAK